jgi:hypothetical protein
MTFKQQLPEDAKNIFTNINEFAETITYTPYGGTSKNIEAFVHRGRIDSGGLDRNRTISRQAEIMIPNDATAGVVAVNKGQDSVSLPIYIGGGSSTWKVVDILSHDEGMWHLLLEF